MPMPHPYTLIMASPLALLLIANMTCLLPAGEADAPKPPHAGWRLAFGDEFEQAGRPDPTKWNFETGILRNEEEQFYQSENAVVADGCLVITGRREEKPNPAFKPGSDNWREKRRTAAFTSASVTTRDRFSWQYGRLEVRVRFVAEIGLWPAIWTLGVQGKWPANGEVDLFEYYKGSILANAIWKGDKRVVKRPLAEFGDPTWADAFHLWTMDWDATAISIAIDGKNINRIELDKVRFDGLPVHPYRQPHYLLLNLAIGGKSGGDPAKATFPSRYAIDYVRVWQAPVIK